MGALNVARHVVVLPGLDGSSALSLPLARELTQVGFAVECVAYPPDRPLTYDGLQGLVRERLDDAPPSVLVAQSFSGPLAMRLAVERPGALRGVVFCATFARLPMGGVMRAAATIGSALGLVGPAVRRPAPIRAFLAGRDAPGALVDEVRAAIADLDPAVLRHRVREILAVDATPALRGLDVPACHVVGTRDRLLGRRGSGQISRLNPAVPTVEVDAPHLVAQTRPDVVASAVQELVGRRAE